MPAWYEDQEPLERLHWHGGAMTLLAGDHRAGYWRGPDGCPPECPGLAVHLVAGGSRKPRRAIAMDRAGASDGENGR